jgi:hypothetical protein
MVHAVLTTPEAILLLLHANTKPIGNKMKTMLRLVIYPTLLVSMLAPTGALAQGKSVNFMTAVPAESELIFNQTIARAEGVNQFAHARKPATVETQTIVRSQSDMLYSQGVFDVSAGLTVTLPACTTGYQSVHMFDANHGQLGVVYCGETRTITAADVSTLDKHIYAMMRTSTDQGLEIANAAQNNVRMETNSNKDYVGPGYDQVQLKQAKRVLAGTASIVKAKTAYTNELVPETVTIKNGSDLDQYNYVLASLLGWGLMPNEHAYYPQLVIKDSDCTEVMFPAPPVRYENSGYWSFTAYGMDGYLRTKNPVVSSYSAKPNDDGTLTVYVGNSDACKAQSNQVDMPKGGTAISLRMYRPNSIANAKAFEKKFRSDNADK